MSELDRLKHLLLAEEREMLARVELRLAVLEQNHAELADRLPSLVRAAPHQPMTEALASPVASALGSAVRDNRTSIVDALFPVIGPIIRKAIAEALRGLMSDLNTVLEHGFSPRGIRWRIEAWRSGVPFAQIVLKHSLRYRIDHVFLIERDSGLVLHRESSPGQPDLDADAIAGMLTAIGQFVRDSVGRDGSESLEAARVGEHLLWVLDGPRASIACFIQGVPPDSLRAVLSERLEQIHAQFAQAAVANQSGAALASADWPASLDPQVLVAASATMSDRSERAASKSSLWPALIILLLVLGALTWFYARSERWDARVTALKAALIAHPGFELSDLESSPWHSLSIRGLIDADAEPITPLLEAANLGDTRPSLHLEGYLSTADNVLHKRANRLLKPPASVVLNVADGVLSVNGEAAQEWIDATQDRAAWIAGIRSVDWQVVPTVDHALAARAELDALSAQLAAIRVLFSRDLEPADHAETQLSKLVVNLNRAQALADPAGSSLRLRFNGYNDTPGSAGLNQKLRTARAVWLRDRLREQGVPVELLQNSEISDGSANEDLMIRGAQVRLTYVVDKR